MQIKLKMMTLTQKILRDIRKGRQEKWRLSGADVTHVRFLMFERTNPSRFTQKGCGWIYKRHLNWRRSWSNPSACYICGVRLQQGSRKGILSSTDRTVDHVVPAVAVKILNERVPSKYAFYLEDIWQDNQEWSCRKCNDEKGCRELTYDLIAKLAADRIDSSFHCCG